MDVYLFIHKDILFNFDDGVSDSRKPVLVKQFKCPQQNYFFFYLVSITYILSLKILLFREKDVL